MSVSYLLIKECDSFGPEARPFLFLSYFSDILASELLQTNLSYVHIAYIIEKPLLRLLFVHNRPEIYELSGSLLNFFS